MCAKSMCVLLVCIGLQFLVVEGQIYRHVIRNLEPPFYLYNNEYIPPLETVDIPVPTTPIATTRATTQRPSTTTTEFFLPEIIVNRNAASEMVAKLTEQHFNGYPEAVSRPNPVYLPAATVSAPPEPPPTILSEEEPAIQNLPPTPPNHYVPLLDPVEQQEEQHDEPNNQYIPPTSSRLLTKSFRNLFRTTTTNQQPSPLRLELSQLRCLASPSDGYFKALLNVQQNSVVVPPIVLTDGEPSAESCGIRMVQSKIIVSIRSSSFQRCGVEPCGGGVDNHQLCLRLSFPQISGMTTAADRLLTLQCKMQEKVISQTHSLHVGVSKDSQARSAGTFAQGGSQQAYRTHISLFHAGRGLNSDPLAPGAVVQLGEELVLRAHVRAGDGWNHTRISDVFLQRLSPNGDILNSANLVMSSGCVDPTMRSICPAQPIFEPPLGHRLTFKAIMFQGMRSGDEMVMSVKVLGCIHNSDCFVDNAKCDRLPVSRTRRHTDDDALHDLSSDVARVSFRVDMPDAAQRYTAVMSAGQPDPVHSIGIIGVVATLSVILLAMLIGLYLRNRRALDY